MTIYQVPAKAAYERALRVFYIFAILVLLAFLYVSVYEPVQITDTAGKILGWIAGSIVLGAIALGMVVSGKIGLRKLQRNYTIELTEKTLIQRQLGTPEVEIPLNTITAVTEVPGWLAVISGDPKSRILIPRVVDDFEDLKRKLASYGPIQDAKGKSLLWLYSPTVLGFLLLFLMSLSHQRGMFLFWAGCYVALIAMATFSTILLWRRKKITTAMLWPLGITWAIASWIIYDRLKNHL